MREKEQGLVRLGDPLFSLVVGSWLMVRDGSIAGTMTVLVWGINWIPSHAPPAPPPPWRLEYVWKSCYIGHSANSPHGLSCTHSPSIGLSIHSSSPCYSVFTPGNHSIHSSLPFYSVFTPGNHSIHSSSPFYSVFTPVNHSIHFNSPF